MLGERVRTHFGEVDLVARRGARLACVEVKSARVVALDFPHDARFRPGKHFTSAQAQRQLRAARSLALALGHRGRVERALFEVWIEKGTGRARGRLHRDLRGGFEAGRGR